MLFSKKVEKIEKVEKAEKDKMIFEMMDAKFEQADRLSKKTTKLFKMFQIFIYATFALMMFLSICKPDVMRIVAGIMLTCISICIFSLTKMLLIERKILRLLEEAMDIATGGM